jgi:transketolase
MTIKPIAMRDALLEKIWQAMKHDEKIFFVTADFGSPVLDKIRADYPERFKNVGIAEQNLINISAGLGLEGFTVFAYAIAPFITMRCYEQLRVSLALLSEVRPLNVNLIGVGAGYSYVVSGPTHQCYEDLTLMRALANFEIYSPSDHITSAALLDKCLSKVAPKYIRLDAQVLPVLYEEFQPNMLQGYQILRSGQNVCLIATGYMVHTALCVAEKLAVNGVEVAVVDLFDIQSFDEKSLIEFISNYKGLVSLEEGFKNRGGVDARFHEFITDHDFLVAYLGIGVQPGYNFELGSRNELHEQVGIGLDASFDAIEKFYKKVS